MERAAVIASDGRRAAQVYMAPFAGAEVRKKNRDVLDQLHRLCGLSAAELSQGWRVGIVAQVGALEAPLSISREVCRKVGANLMAFRSERIQPGVNAEESAPEGYQQRQDMVCLTSWVTLSQYWVLNFITLSFITAINCFGSLTSSAFI